MPNTLCIAGFWAWPKEAVRVDAAYPEFEDWAKKFNSEKFKDWYEKPEENKVVRF